MFCGANLTAIQAEMEKGEKADYSQFKGEKAQSDQLSQEDTHEAHLLTLIN